MTESGGRQNSGGPHRVAFDYIKSQHFRVIHADGAIGSPTPQGNLHIAFFSERPAIPRRIVHELDSRGQIGGALPDEMVSRDSIVREIDCDVHMSLPSAKAFYDWLGTQISEAERAMSAHALKQDKGS